MLNFPENQIRVKNKRYILSWYGRNNRKGWVAVLIDVLTAFLFLDTKTDAQAEERLYGLLEPVFINRNPA